MDNRATTPNNESGTEPEVSTTGPVISMPNTQSADGGAPLISTASPASLMGIASNESDSTGRSAADDEEEATAGQLTEMGSGEGPTFVDVVDDQEVADKGTGD